MFATLLPILGITFIDILGFSILIPIMPYFVQHFGAPKIAVGILFSVFAACQFLSGPIWGNVSDRIGRKRVLIISQVGATLGWTLLACAPTLAWVFVARIIEGASGGNISVTQAYVADRVEPEQRARAFGYVGAAFSAGIVLGPATAGILLAKYGYGTPFLLAATLQLVTLVTTIFLLPESVAAHGEKQEAATFADIIRYLRDPSVNGVLLQKLAYSLGLYGWFSAFALVLQAQLHFGPSATSYFFGGFGVISIIMQLGVVGNLAERTGARIASNIGFTSALVFFLLVPIVHSVPTLAAVIVFFALGLSVTNATLATLLTDAAPERARGTILGVGSSLENFAGIIMPIISTGALTLYGPAWPAFICAFFVCIALFLGLRAQRAESAQAALSG
ncbi:MAG TPA: MFS transporter [Candidatus Baltobacteraceae bacterium]